LPGQSFRNPAVIVYRPSRNTDPPGLTEIWNESVTGRGAYPVRTPALFERWVFSKPYFRHDDVIVAQDGETGTLVGFALNGFGPDEELARASSDLGVVCAVLVRPAYRRRGIGRELLRRSEDALRGRGAKEVVVGSMWPNNPYLFGLYGGSNSPGILDAEPDAGPFLAKLGYTRAEECTVFQRKLDTPLTLADPRFGHLRRRYDAQVLRAAGVGSWWQECQWGLLEPVEMRLTDKLTDLPAARAVLWELEGFSWKWNYPSAGLLDVQVRSDLRRQGLAKMLISQVLRFLQDQFFAVAELQVPASDEVSVGLCRSLGFETVDTGAVYRRPAARPAGEAAPGA
jgi:ribosomal protein S18 acetylase RimI-like enzyme